MNRANGQETIKVPGWVVGPYPNTTQCTWISLSHFPGRGVCVGVVLASLRPFSENYMQQLIIHYFLKRTTLFFDIVYSPLLSYFALKWPTPTSKVKSFACIIIFSLIFQTPKRQINYSWIPKPHACTYELVLFVIHQKKIKKNTRSRCPIEEASLKMKILILFIYVSSSN